MYHNEKGGLKHVNITLSIHKNKVKIDNDIYQDEHFEYVQELMKSQIKLFITGSFWCKKLPCHLSSMSNQR